MWNPFKVQEVATIPLDYAPNMSFDNSHNKILEQFKGEVEQNKVKFPSELGEEHPFDFSQMEQLYKKFGFFTAVVDKYVDFVVGPGFYIKCEDARAKKIIEDFMRDVNLDTLLRQWCKEGLVKGNGFLELGGSVKKGIEGMKSLNANYMYVVRDKLGKITGYNQYKGGFDKFAKDKVIPFTTDQIAHFGFNIIGDSTYGLGIGITALQDVNNLLQNEKDMHYIYHRKANSPLQAKLGLVTGDTKIIPKEEDVIAFGKKMETMDNKTNWATDPLVELKVVDFGNIGEKFAVVLEHDMQKLLYIFQIPPELMGMANIPEGMSRVRMDAFQRRIQSIQAEMEKIIEEKIFKKVLNANGLDVHVEFEWGTPSIMEVEGRMTLISEMIKSPMINPAMKSMLEDEMINLLKFDINEWEKLKLEQEKKEEEERKRLEVQPQPIVPGQNANFPQKVQPKAEQPKQPKPEEIAQTIIKIWTEREEQTKGQQLQQILSIKNDLEKKTKSEIKVIKDEIINKINSYNQQREEEYKKREEERKLNKLKLVRKNKSGLISLKKNNKTSLLPAFRITRKTESAKLPEQEEKLIIKIKRTKEDINYEYEKDCPHCIESWENMNDIEEWLGFNYKDYLKQILVAVGIYEFEQIKAVNEIELTAGYLTDVQVVKLRGILDNGFKKGLGMKEMAKQVDKKVGLKDLYRMNAEGDIKVGASGLPILSRSADKRAIGIVRTEVTRLANQGAVEYYKVNDIANIKWVASFGDRTCPDCEALNGQIFKIGEEPEIPLHPMCRCTYAPVVELK